MVATTWEDGALYVRPKWFLGEAQVLAREWLGSSAYGVGGEGVDHGLPRWLGPSGFWLE